jgi:hypothetical protein
MIFQCKRNTPVRLNETGVINLGNISCRNQPLRENYENFNLSHMMLI